MSLNLDTIINRKDTNSVKWEFVYNDDVREFVPCLDDILSPEQHLALWVADMDFRSPQPVIDALVRRAEHGIFGYTAPTEAYVEAISSWMKRRHNWVIEKEWLLTTPGVVPAICLAIQSYTAPGDKVLIQPPVYHPFFHAIEDNDRIVAHNSMIYEDGTYRMDFDDLARQVRDPQVKMAILCTPHNPVGRVWSAEEIRKFGQICYDNNVLVIADEIHHDLILSGYTFTSYGVVNPDLMDNVIVTTAPSKTFNVPGLKTSNVFIPNPQLRAAFEKTMTRNGVWGINSFGLVALTTAYNEGEEWLAEVLEYIEGNYHYLRQYVAEHMPQIKVTELQGTYLVWLNCRALGMDGNTLWQRLLDNANLFLNNGVAFGIEGDGFMRVNIACPRAVLHAALERLCDFVVELG